MSPPGSDSDSPVARASSREVTRTGAAPETERVLSIFGASKRGGHWEPAERVEAAALFGNVKLDLREASLYDFTRIQCLCLFGNVEVLVPPDVDVDANGLGVFGSFEERRQQRGNVVRAIGRALRGESSEPDLPDEPLEAPPLLKVRGFALFGSVTIKIG